MKKLFFIVLVLIIASLGLNSQAENKPKKDGFKQRGIIEKLNLSEEQFKQFKDFQYELENKLLELRFSIDKNQLELKNLIRNTPIDKAAILNLIDRNSQIQSEIKTLAIENWFKVYDILDADQQKMWVEHFESIEKPKDQKPFMKQKNKQGKNTFQKLPPEK